MKKSFILLLYASILLCSCHTIHYTNDGSGTCYIKTTKGKLWGIGWLGECYVYPEYESVSRHNGTGGWIAYKQGNFYFYDVHEKLRCNGEALLNNLSEPNIYVGRGGLDKLYMAKSQSGIYAIFESHTLYAENTPVYGPYKDFVPGHAGYMFEDIQTGKWGVGKYGDWEQCNPKARNPEDRWKHTPLDTVIVAPEYDKIINIAYENDRIWPKGYHKKSDIRWYCLNGNKWYGFDIDGRPINVNMNLLNTALKIKAVPTRECLMHKAWQGTTEIMHGRIGKEEASVYITKLGLF